MRSSPARRRRRPTASAIRGFTLIEIVVSLAIAGVAVAAGAATLSLLTDLQERGSPEMERALAAVAARDRLVEWLRRIAYVEAPEISAAAGGDRLRFVVDDGGALWPGPRRIEIRVALGAVGDARGLIALVRPLAAGPTDTLVLAAEATGLDVEYRVNVDGRSRWMRRWDPEGGFPRAIRIVLHGTPRIRLGAGAARDLPGILIPPIVVPLQEASG